MSSATITKEDNSTRPIFFRTKFGNDKEKLDKLLSDNPTIRIYDTLYNQLVDLIRCHHPKLKSSSKEIPGLVQQHIGAVPLGDYGVWVYYPWSGRLVHLLDEEEFVTVRTSRNTYKITPEERNVLSTKKVGVIGLSVGQSVALTLAMERGFGELRIADFDQLELSNLNRIRAGVHYLDIPKTTITAREIAEIDPFLHVVAYTDGIHNDNIDHFFTHNGKLDLLIEVCDGLDIKVSSRKKAKELGIPVLMDTSDKGMLDIERFDLEPNRPILHGLIDHLDTSRLKGLTNEQKVPFILPMLGVDMLSTRLKASMMEVEETIPTWPQLASSVALGGALGADTSRRILLGQTSTSGRFYVDFEQIVPCNESKIPLDSEIYDYPTPPWTEEEMIKAAAKTYVKEEGQIALSNKEVETLVKAAHTAPSGGNCQPWQWISYGGGLVLFYDKSVNRSFLDFHDLSAYSSLGAAIENLVLKSHLLGLKIKLDVLPVSEQPMLVAIAKFFPDTAHGAGYEIHPYRELASCIEERHTNRNIRDRKILPSTYIEDLKSVTSSVKGAKLYFTDRSEDISELAEIFAAADRIRLLHPQSHHDLYHNEIRWTREENLAKMDGVDIATIEVTPSELAGFKLAKDQRAISLLRSWNAGRAFEKMTRKVVNASSGIGYIVMPNDSIKDFIEGGRAWQRMWLKATKDGIGVQPLLVPLMFFIRSTSGHGEGLPKNMHEEILSLYTRFKRIFPVDESKGRVFLFRLCIAEKPGIQSLRRPLDQVLHFTN